MFFQAAPKKSAPVKPEVAAAPKVAKSVVAANAQEEFQKTLNEVRRYNCVKKIVTIIKQNNNDKIKYDHNHKLTADNGMKCKDIFSSVIMLHSCFSFRLRKLSWTQSLI